MRVPLDLVEAGVTRRFPHGEVIARQGDAGTSLFLVTWGAVRLSSVTVAGREVVVGILSAGDVFGEAALLGGPSPVGARAVGETCVLALPLQSVRMLLERRPLIAEELLRLIATRLHRTSTALQEALAGDVTARVAGRLVELAGGHGIAVPAGIVLGLPLTQSELARMVGASREAVNRTVGVLAARGLVRSRASRFLITDVEALEREADEGTPLESARVPTPATQRGCTNRRDGSGPGPGDHNARTRVARSETIA
ncbi:MAG: Crp/Fnr family transcriptional regulator [Actinobacteria bacterium]|nr:Crp/Fnr family transcriptional regulator [Actinomycetota bacterium]